MKKIALLCLLFLICLAKMISPMEDKGKGKALDEGGWSIFGKDPHIDTFRFHGRIEPPRAAGQKTNYKLHIVSETMAGVKKFSSELWTDHRFSMPLHFHREELKRTPTFGEKLRSTWQNYGPSMGEVLLESQWILQKWKKYKDDKALEKDLSPWTHGVQMLTVVVESQLPDGQMAKRSWTIWYPDFSLHYQFHFGSFDGQNLRLKFKVALPLWFRLRSDDEMAVMDMEENVQFGQLQYGHGHGQWQRMNEVLRLEDNQFPLFSIYRFDIPLDAEKLSKFLAENLANPRIKMRYSRHKMQETVFNAEKHAKEMETEKNERILKKAAAKNIHQHGNLAETSEQLNPAEVPGLSASAPEQAAKQPSALNSECTFCTDEFKDGETVWRSKFCHHIHHADCVKRWLMMQYASRCPVFCNEKLRGHSFKNYLEGPVFSSSAVYSFEYQFIMDMFNYTPELHKREDEEAKAMSQKRGEQHPDDNDDENGSATIPMRMVGEEEFCEDHTRNEQLEFVEQQREYIRREFHLFDGQTENDMVDHRPEDKLSADSRIQALKVFGAEWEMADAL